MKEIKIILIAAPEFLTNIAEQLQEELPQILELTINNQVKWTIETVTDGFNSVAEDDEELLKGVVSLLDNKEWDYAISLTDIPLFNEDVDPHYYADQVEINHLPNLIIFLQLA